MKVWLDDLKVTSEIMRTEEITEHTYFITDVQYDGIKESLDNGGFVWVENNKVFYSGKKPSEQHIFNQESKQWEIDPVLKEKELNRELNLVWEGIKNMRAYKNSLGFYVPSVDKWFHSDQAAINNYQVIGLSIVMKTFKPEKWKTMDGSWVEMTEELFGDVMSAMNEHGVYNFKIAELHYENVKKSDEPLNYDYKTGWKPNYIDVVGVKDE